MIYVVQPGDTLWKISQESGIPVEEIAWLNQIRDPELLIPGQSLLLQEEDRQGPFSIQVNGFAYPFISPWVLGQTLPYVNLLSVFSYGFTPEGDLLPPIIPDRWMVRQARGQGVPSALVLTPLDRDGVFSNYLIHTLLESHAAQNRLLAELQQTMAEIGYSELNIDFEYILPSDRDRFTDFVALAARTLTYSVSVMKFKGSL